VTGEIDYAAMRAAAKVLGLQELVWLAHAQELSADADAEAALTRSGSEQPIDNPPASDAAIVPPVDQSQCAPPSTRLGSQRDPS